MPLSLTIDLSNVNLQSETVWDTQYKDWKFKGFEMPKEISEWFTIAIDREVKILRSPPKQTHT